MWDIYIAETKIADPASHAKKQVAELDKTAKRSLEKRKFVTEQLEKDRKEIEHIEHQIEQINERYLPLCQNLTDAQERKAALLAVLDECIKDEKRVSSFIIFSFILLFLIATKISLSFFYHL